MALPGNLTDREQGKFRDTAYGPAVAIVNPDGSDVSGGGSSSTTYAVRIDEVGSTTYVGEALPGTLTSAASWRIKRLTETGPDLTIQFADGNSSFDNIWDNRLALSYS